MMVEPGLQLVSTELPGRLEAVLDGLGDGITVQSPSGQLLYANDAAARLSGFRTPPTYWRRRSSRSSAGTICSTSTGRRSARPRCRAAARLRASGRRKQLIRFRTLATGDERWSVVQAIPVHDEAGAVVYAVNIFRDVTVKHEIEREREELLAT